MKQEVQVAEAGGDGSSQVVVWHCAEDALVRLQKERREEEKKEKSDGDCNR